MWSNATIDPVNAPELQSRERQRLLSLVADRSFRYSEEGFTLTSGKTSNYYVDCKQTTLHPEGGYLCGRLLFERLAGQGIGTVGGLTLGADPLVTAISLISHMEGEPMTAAIVRKSAKGHGTGRWIEGPADPARPVAVVDDVVTTGKSTIEAIKRFQEAGFNVVRVAAIVDRNEGGREAISALGFELDALFTIDDVLTHSRRQA
ncbi:MAG: orotate phosphoribosyltransferase [Leptospirillia bacterium]